MLCWEMYFDDIGENNLTSTAVSYYFVTISFRKELLNLPLQIHCSLEIILLAVSVLKYVLDLKTVVHVFKKYVWYDNFKKYTYT